MLSLEEIFTSFSNSKLHQEIHVFKSKQVSSIDRVMGVKTCDSIEFKFYEFKFSTKTFGDDLIGLSVKEVPDVVVTNMSSYLALTG